MTPRWHKSMYNAAFANSSIGSPRFVALAKKQVAFLDRALDLPKQAKILDVPCGVGRHSQLFARKGYQVTGLDISRDCLKIAKQKFAHKNVKYQFGDMSKLQSYRNQYDVVLNLFSSFGYFETDIQNEAVMRGMYAALRPGGKFVLNMIDLDWLMKIFVPVRWTEFDGFIEIDRSEYDKKTQYSESRRLIIENRNGKSVLVTDTYFRLRQYSHSQMRALMRKVGFKNIEVYGDFEGRRFKKGVSTHPIYIGTR